MSKSKKTNTAQEKTIWNNDRNEFRLNNKACILDIEDCSCNELAGDRYIIDCKIKQRGRHEYCYTKDNDFIVKRYSDKHLYLTGKALRKIEDTIKETDALLEEMSGPGYRQVYEPDIGMRISYKSASREAYDFLVSVHHDQKSEHVRIYRSVGVPEMLHALCFDTYRLYKGEVSDIKLESVKKRITYLFESNADSIKDNPLYRSAMENKDDVLQILIKTYYKIANENECSFLSHHFGERALPTLSEKFDKDYYVASNTIDCKLLNRSGYSIIHRPYFAMKNSTHSAWSLNPHRKSGIDAAHVSSKSITFEMFLSLFGCADDPKKSYDRCFVLNQRR